jgi:hypothetical protein
MLPIDPATGAPVSLPSPTVAGTSGPSGTWSPLVPGASPRAASASTNWNPEGVPVGAQANATAGEKKGDLGGYLNSALDFVGLPPIFGDDVKAEGSVAPSANAGVGSYTDANGKPSYGFGADGQTAAASATATWGTGGDNSSYVNVGAKGPNASAGVNANDSTFQFGAQANAAEGAIEAGTKGTNSDESVRVGASEGLGAAGRVHYGDEDGDGLPEYGFGFDWEWFSADVKTEDPLRYLAETAVAGPLAPLTSTASFLAKMAGVDPLEGTNVTQGAKDLWNGLFD